MPPSIHDTIRSADTVTDRKNESDRVKPSRKPPHLPRYRFHYPTKLITDKEISIPNTGIRQGDSLSPVLFNLMMDKLIGNVRKLHVNVVCYADDVMLIAKTRTDHKYYGID